MLKITYAEWLPSSDYEVINAPHFSFTKMDEHKKNYAYSEVWMPVQKNKTMYLTPFYCTYLRILENSIQIISCICFGCTMKR